MRKKIAMSLVLIGLMVAVMAGGTFAYFTSTATNTGNSFAAGTLNIGTTPTTAFLNITNPNLKPGDTGTGTLTIKNNGNLDATLNFTTAVADTPGTNGGKLSEDLYLTITDGTFSYTGKLSDLKTLTENLPDIAANSEQTFKVNWLFKDNSTPGSDTTGDNAYQGSTCVAGFTFNANQVL